MNNDNSRVDVNGLEEGKDWLNERINECDWSEWKKDIECDMNE